MVQPVCETYALFCPISSFDENTTRTSPFSTAIDWGAAPHHSHVFFIQGGVVCQNRRPARPPRQSPVKCGTSKSSKLGKLPGPARQLPVKMAAAARARPLSRPQYHGKGRERNEKPNPKPSRSLYVDCMLSRAARRAPPLSPPLQPCKACMSPCPYGLLLVYVCALGYVLCMLYLHGRYEVYSRQVYDIRVASMGLI